MSDEQPKKNRYLRFDREDFWKWRPDWYKVRHRMAWYENIDLKAMREDGLNEDAEGIIHDLVGYIRVRDQVIQHRESVAFHTGQLLRFVLGARGTKYTSEELNGVLKMIQEYLVQMQVISALEPDAPTRFPLNDDAE